jgi:hypothetical protein
MSSQLEVSDCLREFQTKIIGAEFKQIWCKNFLFIVANDSVVDEKENQ